MTYGVSEFISRATNNYDYLRNILPHITLKIVHHFQLVGKTTNEIEGNLKQKMISNVKLLT